MYLLIAPALVLLPAFFCAKHPIQRIIGMTMLLLCVTGTASALTDVLEERIILQAPAGITFSSISKADGELKIAIDTRNSDWSRAMIENGDTSSVDIMFGIKAPCAEAVCCVSACGMSMDDPDALEEEYSEEIRRFDDQGIPIVTNGTIVAQCISDYRIVVPCSEELFLYVKWYDKDGNALPYDVERLRVTTRHTAYEGMYAPFRFIPENSIMPSSNLGGIHADTADGEVIYKQTGNLSANTMSIATRIQVPAGATKCNLLDLYDGNRQLNISNGQVTLETPMISSGARRYTYGLEFLNDQGETINYAAITIEVQALDAQPWPAYLVDWEPVPSNNLKLNVKGSSGLRMAYDGSGILKYDYDGIVDDVEILKENGASYSIVPPENAAYMRYNCSGGMEGLLGNRPSRGVEADEAIQNWGDCFENLSENEAVTIWEGPILQCLNTYDGVTLFIPTVPTNLDAGMVHYMYWYESKGAYDAHTPSAIWWFAEVSDPFVKAVRIPAYRLETQLPPNYNGAIVISDQNWTMVTESYLQQGENALHYELHLIDADGSPVSLDADTVVYLPYPDGLSYEDNVTYALRHYNENGGSELVTSLTPTEIGLRFEVRSLSPFVLQWEGQPSPETTPVPAIDDLPQTGDQAPYTLAIGVWILSAVGLFLLMRHRRCTACDDER